MLGIQQSTLIAERQKGISTNIAVIEDPAVIEKILRHLKLW